MIEIIVSMIHAVMFIVFLAEGRWELALLVALWHMIFLIDMSKRG